MRHLILAAAALFVAGTAAAEQPAAETNTAAPAGGGRVIYVCDRSDPAQRAVHREHTFVSAQELARAAAANENWSAPRCITPAELQRYEDAYAKARVQQTSNTVR